MSRKILLITQLILLICCVVSKPFDEPKLKIPNHGMVKGSINQTVWTKQNYMQFLGIPYAESPTKYLRMKAPVPKGQWYDVKDVTKYGRRCPTLELLNQLNDEELKEDLEDCLNLSVFTKDLKAKRPVLIYIHGGAFNSGGSYKTPAGYFMEKDIVVVVPQYRLGHFGFLSTQSEGMPGNAALLDLILSLKWVNENIEHFGGDPENITIAGHSAGSVLVNALLVSPAVPKGLFQRGIMASGAASVCVKKNHYEIAQNVCKQICRACRNPTEINHCFMDVPVRTILETKVQESFSLTLNDFYGLLPESPEILAEKNQNKLPVMASVSKQDGAAFVAMLYLQLKGEDINAYEFAMKLISLHGDENMSEDEIKSVINYVLTEEQQIEKDLTKVFPNLVDLCSIIAYKMPLLNFIQTNSINTNNHNYISTFDYRGEYTKFKLPTPAPELSDKYPFKNGVHHATEIFLLFNTHNLNENDTEVSKIMIDLWTSFMMSGEPSTPNAPKLMPVTANTSPYFHINSEITIADNFDDEYLISINEA